MALLAAGLAVPALAASGSVRLRNDPAKATIVPAAGEAVVVALLDDPDHLHHMIAFQLYDVAARKLVVPARGEKRVYGFGLSFAKLGGVAQDVGVYVGVVPAGDYVLLGETTEEPKVNSFCFGAPVMHVASGSVSFIGGFRPYNGNHFATDIQRSALRWDGDVEQARAALGSFSALRDKLAPAPISNGAVFECSGDNMWAYRVPGAPDLPPIG